MIMTCRQFRDALDCYLDHELAEESMAAAERHRAQCAACERLATAAEQLRIAVRHAVAATPVPADLEARIRRATAPPRRWQGYGLAAAAAVLLVAALGSAVMGDTVTRGTANTMDGLALRLDDSSEVVLRGTLLCRDCELERRYGIAAPCRTIGHHGAIATADGRIWNLVEQSPASALIHDSTLLGRRIVVRGRVFRGARAMVVESYGFTS